MEADSTKATEQAMSEELNRTRRVGGEHRASAKWIVKAVDNILEYLDLSQLAAHIAKLSQQKFTLRDKVNILEALVKEILGLVEEEQIEEEIEQADILKERLLLAIVQIDEAISMNQSSSEPVNVNGTTSS